ncbi:A24 family peptidase [Sphingobium sp. H39-3-25]|uniref:prepilin peptidase n=2 Tax=Sphingomonadaceae TaxID=41297 RepID=UPI003018C9C3|nr:A24 family peptidase [Sphingobium arseniciresistens]
MIRETKLPYLMIDLAPDLRLIAALGLVGALVGSFIAAAVIRWGTGQPIVVDRSRCDHCARVLSPAELIPLLSAIISRFRCRTCNAPIDALHWQIETAACLVGILAGMVASGTPAVAGAIFGWQLLALGSIDLRHFILPNLLTAGLAITGLAASLVGAGVGTNESLVGGLVGFLSLWLVKHGYRRLRGRDGLGGGDPKLFGGIGCWLGWQTLPHILLGASLIGLIAAVAIFRDGEEPLSSRRLPFGICLAVGGFTVWIALQMGRI